MLSFNRSTLFGSVILFVLTACGGSSSSDEDDEGGLAVVSTVAGDGTKAYFDATGLAAQFNEPKSITTDGINLYVTDGNNRRIRQIAIASGVVTTFAGDGTAAFLDGIGVAAQLAGPNGIANDGASLYFTDTDSIAGSLVREADIVTANVDSIAGDPAARGLVDAVAAAAQFSDPQGITTDGTDWFVADTYNNAIRQLNSAASVTTIAGDGTPGFVDDTGGAARFLQPFGIATDGTNLYVADTNNHSIRQVVIASGVVTTLAGNGAPGFADGTGSVARFNVPLGITTDGVNLYVTDGANHRIRQVVIATAVVTTLAGDGNAGHQDGSGTATRFNVPWGITSIGKTLYVVDKEGNRVRRVQLP